MSSKNFALLASVALASLTACSSAANQASSFLPGGVSAQSGTFDDAGVDTKGKSKWVVTSAKDTGKGTLRDVIAAAPRRAKITFDLHYPAHITLTHGAIDLKKNVRIEGPGASKLQITTRYKSQIFTVASTASVTLSGMTLTGAASTSGSAPTGGAIYNGGTLTLQDDAVTKSFAEATGAAIEPARERRIVFDPRPRKRGERAPRPPHAPRGIKPDISSTGDGGAVYNAKTLNVDDTNFTSNSVQEGNGGAIYNASTGTLTVTGGTFSGNEGGYGGAINNQGAATISSATFTSNQGWPGGGAPVAGGFGFGGAIYAAGSLTISSCTFTSNVAGGTSQQSFGKGGAIAQITGTLTVSGSTFSNNLAGGGTNGSYGYGGAIYAIAPPAATLTTDTFTGNVAGGDAFGYGGALYAQSAVSGSGNTFGTNTVEGTASGGYAYGGAIFAAGGLTQSGDTFTSNVANGATATGSGYGFGGAIDAEASVSLSSTAFNTNSASAGTAGTAEGGAVVLNGGTSTWQGVTFTGNAAVSGGGASYAAGGGVLTFAPLTIEPSASAASSFSANKVISTGNQTLGGLGGGVAVEEGPFAFNGTVEGNSASTQGGGLWLDDVSTVQESTISTNAVSATQFPNDGGGGIYVGLGGVLTLGTTTISANTVGGTATASGGGGIFSAGSSNIYNTTITSNISSVDGGGVENDAQTGLALTNVTIYENSAASGNGGSLKNLYADSTMTVANSILAGGVAATGADVSNDGTVTSNNYNLIQTAPAGNAIAGTTTNDLAANPSLLSLASNGGPTMTNADQATSPGTGYIPYAICAADGITTDQRGEPRNVGNGCDVGAYQYQ